MVPGETTRAAHNGNLWESGILSRRRPLPLNWVTIILGARRGRPRRPRNWFLSRRSRLRTSHELLRLPRSPAVAPITRPLREPVAAAGRTRRTRQTSATKLPRPGPRAWPAPSGLACLLCLALPRLPPSLAASPPSRPRLSRYNSSGSCSPVSLDAHTHTKKGTAPRDKTGQGAGFHKRAIAVSLIASR